MELKRLEDLEKYITILIVESDNKLRDELQSTFKQVGYKFVWAVEKAKDAFKYLSKTNIMITNHNPSLGLNGIELADKAKKEYGDRIQTVIFSGDSKNFDSIQRESAKAKVAACFRTPLEPGYIKLWIKEFGKRIWMQQILDNAPDEVLIKTKNGTILYVSKEKEKLFGEKLIGDKCYKRFEYSKFSDRVCDNCPGIKAFDGKTVVRAEWNYQTRADLSHHKIHQMNQSVELVAAPLFDRQNKPRAIIEIARDITIRKNADALLKEIEMEPEWEKRSEIFTHGFKELGIPRARFYLHNEEKKLFHLIEHHGNYNGYFNSSNFYLDSKDDQPTRLVLQWKKPLFFKIDTTNHNKPYTQDTTIKNLYWVGKNNVKYVKHLKTDEWIDIPLTTGNTIIGKVSIDGWKEGECPDSYELEVLTRYCCTAGQMIDNARTIRNIEQLQKTEETILEISKKITKITNLTNKGQLLNIAVKLACETMETRDCSIFLFDEKAKLLKRSQSYGINKRTRVIVDFPENEFYKLGQSITGWMFQKNTAGNQRSFSFSKIHP
jgi:PAS domain-containing protein